MPQIFQVLRCYKCFVFQVQLTKKSIKWECKLCGEKQSMKRHYGIGTAKDCRIHVQKLNNLRGEIDELKCSEMVRNAVSDDEETENITIKQEYVKPSPVANSKWSDYVENEPVPEVKEVPLYLGDAEVVLEMPKQKKESRNYSRTSKNVSKRIPTACTYQQVEKKWPESDQADTSDNILQSLSCNVLDNPINKPEALPKDEKDKEISKKKFKTFVPPVVNKNSKWAQFAEDKEPTEESELLPSIKPSQNELFSLCNDNELDDFLEMSF